MLVGRRGNRHRAVLVVTDGVDTGSRRTAEEVSGVAAAAAVPVHLLTVSGPLDRRDGLAGAAGADGPARAATLGDLARWTGGSVRATGTEDDMLESLAQLLLGLRYQYVVTFEPGALRGWHPIEIRTTDGRHVVQARSGYMAGPARLQR